MSTKTHDTIIQAYGHLLPVRLGLTAEVRHKSVAALNRMLAHCLALRDLYKLSHWQTSGATFYQLHLLFDKHYEAQAELADAVAERVQTLGGVTHALAEDVQSETRLARLPRGRESAPDNGARSQISRSKPQAANLVGSTSSILSELTIGIARGFMASGTSRTRSM